MLTHAQTNLESARRARSFIYAQNRILRSNIKYRRLRKVLYRKCTKFFFKRRARVHHQRTWVNLVPTMSYWPTTYLRTRVIVKFQYTAAMLYYETPAICPSNLLSKNTQLFFDPDWDTHASVFAPKRLVGDRFLFFKFPNAGRTVRSRLPDENLEHLPAVPMSQLFNEKMVLLFLQENESYFYSSSSLDEDLETKLETFIELVDETALQRTYQYVSILNPILVFLIFTRLYQKYD